MNRPLILGIIGVISLLWGIYDVRRKEGKQSPAARMQSWAQIIAGLIAIYFSLLGWKV